MSDTRSDTRMDASFWHNGRARRIVERVVVEGDLMLLTPAHFGNGDGSDETDLPLLADNYDPKRPVLTGASLAGALRAYLRRISDGDRELDTALFGGTKGDDDGEQSPLIVDDALGTSGANVELRDGVKLDPKKRTAADKALFNIETWAAGTTFPLRLELLLVEGKDRNAALQALAAALTGLTNDGITLGMRKQRGYGRVRVSAWRVRRYRLADSADDLLNWLKDGNLPIGDQNVASVPVTNEQGEPLEDREIMARLLKEFNVVARPLARRDRIFKLSAEFTLESSLMIRGNTGRDDLGPDMVHLHSRRNGKEVPILSGTSLAGALRGRALRILNTLNADKAQSIVEDLFGPDMKPGVTPKASRLITAECEVRNVIDNLVQNRIRVDRFTGGVIEGALFEEQPVFAKPETRLTLGIHVREPKDYEIGLLLLLLKDLWTGDLPLGGEIGIGRGRLRGRWADMIWRHDGQEQRWRIEQKPEGMTFSEGDKAALEHFVSHCLRRELQGEEVAHGA